MYDTQKLKARILEMYGTQDKFAEKIGISKATLSRHLGGTRSEWKGKHIIKAIRALNISDSEIDMYFFTPAVAKTPPRKK